MNETCIEVLACKVRRGKEKEFVDIETARKSVMNKEKPEGCLDRFLIKVPFLENVYLLCTKWVLKDRALQYCG